MNYRDFMLSYDSKFRGPGNSKLEQLSKQSVCLKPVKKSEIFDVIFANSNLRRIEVFDFLKKEFQEELNHLEECISDIRIALANCDSAKKKLLEVK